MFRQTRFTFYYWLMWIAFFEIARLGFMVFNVRESMQLPGPDILKPFLYGLRMDASMAAYLCLPVCLFLLLSPLIQFLSKPIVFKIYTSIVLVPIILIIFCDMPAYQAWGFRLDVTPLKYLASPKEAWASVSHLPVFWIAVGIVLIYWIVLKLFNRFINKHGQFSATGRKRIYALLVLLVFTASLIIPLRGGFQLAPINQSSVYFSHNQFANLSAINVTWNFMHSISHKTGDTSNPYVYMTEANAETMMHELFPITSDTAGILLKNNKPNIILIIWESFTSKAVGLEYQGVEVTPGFNKLKEEGLYFSESYASGDRTDKGIVAILSGYPAQPTTSIIKIPQKASKLPNMVRQLSKTGYHTSFHYGGELEFANMKAYLLGSGFGRFTSKSDFDGKDQNSKWGAHDHIVKDQLQKDVADMQEPFFSTWLTLSSHEPYETPVDPVITGKKDVSQFLNSIHYTDSVVFAFIRYCETQPWWGNTVIAITGDHGHRLPYTGKKIDDFRTPLLLLGGAIKSKPAEIKTTISQIDIPAILVAQLGLPGNSFTFSKDFTKNDSRHWAYFSFNNGFGFVQDGRYFIFDNVGKQVIEQAGNITDDDILKGKALQQKTMADYLSR